MPSRLPGLNVHVDGGSVTTAGRGTRNVSGARRGSNIGLHTWAVMEPACSRLGTGLAGAGDPTARLGLRACFAAIRPRREDAPSRSHYFRGCPSLLRWLRARARLRRRSLPSRCCCAVAGVEQGAPGSRLFPEEDAACLPCLCFLPVLWGESPHGRLGGLLGGGLGKSCCSPAAQPPNVLRGLPAPWNSSPKTTLPFPFSPSGICHAGRAPASLARLFASLLQPPFRHSFL